MLALLFSCKRLKIFIRKLSRVMVPCSKSYMCYYFKSNNCFGILDVILMGICYGCRNLDKTISNLEMELAAARAAQESIRSGAPVPDDIRMSESSGKRKYLMVVGINTAFSSRKRRDSVRATWMPQGS